MAETVHTRRPGNHKKLIILLVLLILAGVVLILMTWYSPIRNDADGAPESRRKLQEITAVGWQI